MGFISEFREFAVKGNVVDMAVGIIIGAAFTGAVQSLVKDVMMPPLGLVTGGADFSDKFIVLKQGTPPAPYASLAAAAEAGATTLSYGVFINTIINFLIVAFAVFLLIKWINRLKRPSETPAVAPTVKKCTFCKSDIAIEATRCAYCTSQL